MSSFEIADGPTKLPLTETSEAGGRAQKGTLTLTVRNQTERARTARVTIELEGAAKPAWFAFEGAAPTSPREIECDFDAKGSTTVRVNVSVPRGEAPGSHILRVRATAEDDPDNDFTVGPNIAFEVAAWLPVPPPPPPGKIPRWAIAVAGVLLVAGGAGVAYFFLPNGPPPPPECRNPIYPTRPHKGCGVKQYLQAQDPVCGQEVTESLLDDPLDTVLATTPGGFEGAAALLQGRCEARGGTVERDFERFQLVRCVENDWCRHENFGVEEYNSCEDPSLPPIGCAD